MLVIAPLSMNVDSQAIGKSIERVGQWLVTLALLFVVFASADSLPFPFIVLPAAVWGALRFGVRTATSQLFVISVIVVAFTPEGRGPLYAVAAARNLSTTGVLNQVFLISSALVLLPLAVVVAQREVALEKVSSSEDIFRQGFRESLLGMMMLRRIGGTLRVVEFNDRTLAMLGVTSEDLIDTDWLEVVRTGIIGEGPDPGKSWRREVRLDVDNTPRSLDVAVSPMRTA